MSTPGNEQPNKSTDLESETEKVNGWSQEDRRLFLITFLGGLAANIGVVLIVGAAIAVDRFGFRAHSPIWVHVSFVLGGCILGALTGLVAHSIVPNRGGIYGTVGFITVSVLLILLGYAVGIGK